MVTRNRRWFWLTLFALVNLICWVGGAIAVGLVVGERVDLGVETLIRQGQATAVAAWKQASQSVGRSPGTPEAPSLTDVPAAVETIEPGPTATQAPSEPSTSGAIPQAGVTPAAASTSAGESSVPAETPSPEPEATLVSSPLLLADPEITSLATLNAEMSRSAPDRPVQIRYQEDTLNREIAALWRNNPELPYRDVTVDLQPGRVAVTGRVTVLGFTVEAEVKGKVLAQDCVPLLEMESLSVAGIMTPRFVKDQVQDMVFEAMSWYPADYPLCLEEIVLEDSRATVYGYRR
jgi:hypothetical protein